MIIKTLLSAITALTLMVAGLMGGEAAAAATAEEDPRFTRMDVFDLQWVSDPQISPGGEKIVYVRRGMDIMEDRRTAELWIMNADGTGHRKLTERDTDESSPRWSPDGEKIAFRSSHDTHGMQIYIHWLEQGRTARITEAERSPGNIAWSPDGEKIAFSAHVPESQPSMVTPPSAPDGAEWADEPRVETRLNHESDGTGVLEYGYDHLFVVPVDGGHERQVTSGDYHHSSTPSWTPDGQTLVFSANRHDDWDQERNNSEIYKVDVDGGEITQLTDRYGPHSSPVVSPDGQAIAFTSYEDQVQTYQINHIYTMNLDGSNRQRIETGMDRSPSGLRWDEDGQGLYFHFLDQGISKAGHTDLAGNVTEVARDLGGTSIGRPYVGGSFSVADNGRIAFNYTRPDHPGELAITSRSGEREQLTDLNGPLLDNRKLGEVREVWYESSKDGLDLHGWIITPPDYDPDREYPLMVELHGGPINSYGEEFAAEVQLYASADYVVFYPNFRGSTGYGEDYGNELYHAFPGPEFQDIMDGVDLLIEQGYVAEDSLYVTGGSAGGSSSAWAVGKTDRFQAAAVQKPVMNWISKTMAADNYYGYWESRYPGYTWENPMEYWETSPISLAGEVETPTMVIVGDLDLRTPTWEAKQLYNVLRVREIDTAYVEVPDAWHGIASRPSQLITKVDHILAWMDKYRDGDGMKHTGDR